MQINSINSQTFGNVSASHYFILKSTAEQQNMFRYVCNQKNIMNNPNLLHFHIDGKDLILAVFDATKKLMKEFKVLPDSAQETLNNAIKYFESLPIVSETYDKHPINFEELLASCCGSQWH